MKRREKILVTALEMFNESGLHAVGVREIAKKLSISVGNLTYHFPKKEDIVTEILWLLNKQNTNLYEDFFIDEPSLESFLQLMKGIFENQYEYRGVVISAVEVKRVYEQYYDFNAVEEKRLTILSTIITKLIKAGELKLNGSGKDFMVSFMSLFSQYWIQEAFVTYGELSKEEVIEKYLLLLSQQLAIFATPQGLESMDFFFSE